MELDPEDVLAGKAAVLLTRITKLQTDAAEHEAATRRASAQAAAAAEAAEEAAKEQARRQAAERARAAEAARAAADFTTVANVVAEVVARTAEAEAARLAAEAEAAFIEIIEILEPEPEPEPYQVRYPLGDESIYRWREAGESLYASVIQRCWRRCRLRQQTIKALLEREDTEWREKQRQETLRALEFLDDKAAQAEAEDRAHIARTIRRSNSWRAGRELWRQAVEEMYLASAAGATPVAATAAPAVTPAATPTALSPAMPSAPLAAAVATPVVTASRASSASMVGAFESGGKRSAANAYGSHTSAIALYQGQSTTRRGILGPQVEL